MQPTPKKNNYRYLIIIVTVLALGLYFVYKASTKPTAQNDTSTVTETSSDVTSTPPSVQPKNSNINRMKEVGLSVKQIDALQFALYQFSQKSALSVTDMVIDPATIKHTLPEAGTEEYDHLYTFGLTFGNGKDYNARLVSIGLSRAQLTLFDKQGNQVHDSGVIDINSATN